MCTLLLPGWQMRFTCTQAVTLAKSWIQSAQHTTPLNTHTVGTLTALSQSLLMCSTHKQWYDSAVSNSPQYTALLNMCMLLVESKDNSQAKYAHKPSPSDVWSLHIGFTSALWGLTPKVCHKPKQWFSALQTTHAGAVRRVGRCDAYATEFDLEAEEYVPLPKVSTPPAWMTDQHLVSSTDVLTYATVMPGVL